MADPPKEGQPQGDQPKAKPDLRYDDIVAKVVGDSGQPSGTTLLSGYIGRGDQGRVRIYPDLSFQTYHDVAEEDIVHSVPIPDAPHGGSYVWVKPGAAAGAGGGPEAQAAQAQAARVPFTVFPQITCGFVCHTHEDCNWRTAQVAAAAPAAQAVPFSLQHTCGIACTAAPPCPQPTGPFSVQHTCGIACTVAPPCPQPFSLQPTCGIACTAVPPCPQPTVPFTLGMTCPRHICTETIPPTHVFTCNPQVCNHTQAQAAAMPGTFFETCGIECKPPSGHVGICATQLCFQGAQAQAQAAGVMTFHPTQCTRCFICPPVTMPQNRTGVFCPFG